MQNKAHATNILLQRMSLCMSVFRLKSGVGLCENTGHYKTNTHSSSPAFVKISYLCLNTFVSTLTTNSCCFEHFYIQSSGCVVVTTSTPPPPFLRVDCKEKSMKNKNNVQFFEAVIVSLSDQMRIKLFPFEV